MELPPSSQSYKDVGYWNERYQTEDNYEWFKSYKDFMPLLKKHVKISDRILMLGCGNSSLSEHMYNDGFLNIVNVDFSDVVLKKMFLRAPMMDWLTMDIQHLTFKDESFDVVLEKGTLDALLAGEDVWDVSQEGKTMVTKVMDNVENVLAKNGSFISVTFAQPHFRLPLMKRDSWKIERETFGDGFHYFFYVACKLISANNSLESS